MHVVVGIVAHAGVFFVGDVDATDKTHTPVAHHDLAVGAVVDHRAQASANAGVVKPRHLYASLCQRVHERAPQALRTQRVHQEPHLHPLAGFLDQQQLQLGAGVVGLEDVVLQMHMMPRLADRLKNCIEGALATNQQAQVGGGGDRDTAGRVAQPGQLCHVPRGSRCHLAQAGDVGPHEQVCLVAQAP